MNLKDIKWSSSGTKESSLGVFLILTGLILSPILFIIFFCPCVNPTPDEITVILIVLEGIAVGASLRLARYKDKVLGLLGMIALGFHLLIVLVVVLANLKYLMK